MIETPQKLAEGSSPANAPRGARRWLSLAAFVALSGAFILAVQPGSPISALPAKTEAGFEAAGGDSPAAQNERGDFSQFPHSNSAHSRLPCLLCHRRETNSPAPNRSLGHTPCAGCHAQQFAASSGPVCTICHAKLESGSHEVKPFPSLKSFNMKFDHARHRNTVCATCHKPDSRGVAVTIPAGLNAHRACYQCHAPRAQAEGRDISSCGVCHQPGPYSRTPVFSRTYRANFSHSKHGARQKLRCNDCHSIKADAPQGRQVTAPVLAEHFGSDRSQSCMTCHNNKRAFGTNNFADCKRCHQGPTFRF